MYRITQCFPHYVSYDVYTEGERICDANGDVYTVTTFSHPQGYADRAKVSVKNMDGYFWADEVKSAPIEIMN